MKALNLLKNYPFLSLSLLILTAAGCKKSDITENDPGYGCSTSVVQRAVTSATASVLYNNSTNQWMLFVNQSNYPSQSCYACDNAAFKAITDQHAITDVFTVTVSGNITKLTASQKNIDSQDPQYYEPYLLRISNVNQ